MRKAGFWKTDWFLGVAVVVRLVLFDRASKLIPSLERKARDLGVFEASRVPLDKIAAARRAAFSGGGPMAAATTWVVASRKPMPWI